MSEIVCEEGSFQNPEEHRIVGIVEVRPPDKDYVRLRPLHWQENGRWREIHNPRDLYPSEGLVFWWNAPSEAVVGSVWEVGVFRHGQYGTPKKDWYQVAQPTSPLMPCLDYPMPKDDDEILRAFAKDGIRVLEPMHGPVLVRISNDTFLGPVTLKLGKDNRWFCPEEERVKFPIHTLPSDSVLVITSPHVSARYVLRPECSLPRSGKLMNIQTDSELLRPLVRRIGRLDRDAQRALGVTQAVFHSYIEVMQRAELLDQDRRLEEARQQRLNSAIASIKRSATCIEEVARMLLETPAVSERVEAEARIRVAELIGHQRTTMEETLIWEFEERRKRLQELDAGIGQRLQELQDLDARLEQARNGFECEARKFEESLRDHIESICKDPVRHLANSTVVRLLTSNHEPSTFLEQKSQFVDFEASTTASLATAEEVVESIRKRAKAMGIRPETALAAISVCIAGGMPILCGPETDITIRCIASSISSGHFYSVPISGALYRVEDLFGYVDTAGKYHESPAGMATFLEWASTVDSAIVCVLEGINRSPVEAYLLPLILSLRDSQAGCEQVRFHLAPPSCERQFGLMGISRAFKWPANVLLIGTAVEGEATFPLPRDILNTTGVVPSWFGFDDLPVSSQEELAPVTHITKDFAHAFLRKCDTADCGTWLKRLECALSRKDGPLARNVVSLFASLKSALGGDASVQEVAMAFALALRLFPAIPKKDREEILSMLKLEHMWTGVYSWLDDVVVTSEAMFVSKREKDS